MKANLRKSLIKIRMAQSEEEISRKSQEILTRLLASGILENAKRVMVYKDFRKEVETHELIDYLLSKNIQVVLPRVSDDFKTMDLYLISGQEDMQVSSYGIEEPIPNESRKVEAGSLDLVLAPGVGFTKDCYRIGYGGGFYDKMLSGVRDLKVCALAFQCQIVDTLPIEAHDQQLDMVITEEAIYTNEK